jgi:hypothetical protein
MAEREIEILEKQLAAERRLEAAENRAADMIREAETLLEKAEDKYDDAYRYRYPYIGYYPYYKHWKHLEKRATHYKSRHRLHHRSKLKAVPHGVGKPRHGRKMRSRGHSASRSIKRGIGARHRSPARGSYRSSGHRVHGRSSIHLRLR